MSTISIKASYPSPRPKRAPQHQLNSDEVNDHNHSERDQPSKKEPHQPKVGQSADVFTTRFDGEQFRSTIFPAIREGEEIPTNARRYSSP
jgi:hypothetical protein